MHRLFITFFVFDFVFGNTNEDCPAFINCKTSEKPHLCPEGSFYRERVKVNHCCPGCVQLKGEGHPCQTSVECQPGLTCSTEKLCEGNPAEACEYYKRFNSTWKKNKHWQPACLPDGSYAPKQCKGEKMSGKCYCSDSLGNRIFGEETWAKSENMTCACSRTFYEMEKESVTLHCDRLGNFETLQCEQKICWCGSPYTGFPYTIIVPFEMMTSLPCYNINLMGKQYYRKCDSEYHRQNEAKSLLVNHGTNEIFLIIPNCNPDGSYHRVQTFKDKSKCVFLNDLPLTEAVTMQNSDCNCAYDKHLHRMHQIGFFFDCQPNGNYVEKQIANNQTYCVDSDGFIYSVDSKDCNVNE